MEPGAPAYTDGADAAALIEAYSYALDEWQRIVLDAWCARTAADEPVYTECGLSLPRQNGKNGVLEAYEFYKALVCGERILHTAHQVRTSTKSFKKLASLFEDPLHPEVGELVEDVRRTNGEQGIYLKNGGLVEYSARSRGASRGNTYSMVVYDEAQELTDEQVEALMPVIAASPTGYRQTIYLGTPPGPTSPGTVLARVRRAALDSPSPRTCWHEWGVDACPPKTTFADVRELVYDTNPAMGIRLSEEFAEEEWRTMSADGFARERLNWWSEVSSGVERVIDAGRWAACRTDLPPADGLMCCAVKFAPDGSAVSLAVCLRPEGGRPYVECVDSRSMKCGVGWHARWLAKRAAKIASVAVDGRVGTTALVSKLAEAGFPQRAVVTPRSSEFASAVAMFVNAVNEGQVEHYGQPALDDSATLTARRRIGSDGFGFESTESADATLVEACALAYWQAMTTKRRPGRKAVVY